MKILKSILSLALLLSASALLQLGTVEADAKVDGFFKEDLVKEGYFAETASPVENLNKNSRPSFFITREERRANPAKAPSNNIEIPQHSIRMRSRTIGFPTSWGQSVYSSGILVSQ